MRRSLIWKRRMICLLACGIAALLTAGCANGNNRDVILYDPAQEHAEGAGEKISLTFFGFKADAINLTAIEAAMQSFMSVHKNIDITYEGIKGGEYWDVFDKRDEAGMMDDICMMHHDHVISLVSQGKLADLSELPGIRNYTDEAKTQFTNADGSVYFLPTQNSTYNLYINYDLLKEHGQKIPENWNAFQECCDYFAGRGIVPIIANNRNSLPTLIICKGLFDFYQQPDVEEYIQKFNEDPSLLAQKLRPGVEQVADMLDRGWFDKEETLRMEQTSDDLAAFLKGDRPFMITGGWASVRVAAENPDFDYGVHPYPILEDGCVMAIQVDTCISVNANSAHLKEAKEFVAHLIEPDVMWAYCDSQASYTPLKEDRTLSEKTLNPSVPYLTNGRIVFRSDYRLDLPTEEALRRCAETLLNGGTVSEAQAVLSTALSQKTDA